jgi:hypothetical protein
LPTVAFASTAHMRSLGWSSGLAVCHHRLCALLCDDGSPECAYDALQVDPPHRARSRSGCWFASLCRLHRMCPARKFPRGSFRAEVSGAGSFALPLRCAGFAAHRGECAVGAVRRASHRVERVHRGHYGVHHAPSPSLVTSIHTRTRVHMHNCTHAQTHRGRLTYMHAQTRGRTRTNTYTQHARTHTGGHAHTLVGTHTLSWTRRHTHKSVRTSTPTPTVRTGTHRYRRAPRDCQRAAVALGSPVAPVSSGPGLGPPRPHLHQDWAHPGHICTRTGPTPATSAPGLGSHYIR